MPLRPGFASQTIEIEAVKNEEDGKWYALMRSGPKKTVTIISKTGYKEPETALINFKKMLLTSFKAFADGSVDHWIVRDGKRQEY